MSDESGNFSGSTTSLVVPRGRPGLAPLFISLSEIHKIENRIQEIRGSNPATMPDLIADFNYGYILLGKAISKVQLELSEAEIAYNEIKSITLLDKVESILEEKGIKSTADMREAELLSNSEGIEAKRRIWLLKSYMSLLTNKAKSLEMAYKGAKEINKSSNSPNKGVTAGGY